MILKNRAENSSYKANIHHFLRISKVFILIFQDEWSCYNYKVFFHKLK